MIAADRPIQRPGDAKLLVVDAGGRITHAPRSRIAEFLRAGDLVVANDAATLPASLHGVHLPSRGIIEVRLAGRSSLTEMQQFSAIVFGAGDYRTRTEDRVPPPALASGDRLALGPLTATIERVLGHPRLVLLRFSGPNEEIWKGLARHGRPIQYAHVRERLALWDVWTRIAGPPVAFEPPSAGFLLDWAGLAALRRRGVGFATITHAAGISSTGDPVLDRQLPFAEPYRISVATARAIDRARMHGRRIIAIGTTVVRALEHAAACDGALPPGDGLADQRIGPGSRLRVVDAIVSGTHESEGSHYQVLRAFVEDTMLADVDAQLEAHRYRTHEFGDSILVEASRSAGGADHIWYDDVVRAA